MNNDQFHNDEELVRQFRAGVEAGTTDLYNKFYKELVYFARQIIDHASEAEDIVQEMMIKLFQRRQDFDVINEIRAFLYVSVRNACLNYLKARNRHELSHRELRYLGAGADEQAEHEMLKATILAEIFREISILPDQCRKVFELIYIQKRSTSEIASEMGISSQTVLNHKARAINILRNHLTEKGFLSLLLLLEMI